MDEEFQEFMRREWDTDPRVTRYDILVGRRRSLPVTVINIEEPLSGDDEDQLDCFA